MAISRAVGYTTTPGATFAGANYVPELYAMKTLRKFYKDTMFSMVTNTDYEGEFKNKGDKITIRKTPDITVSAYTVGEAITYQVPAEDSLEMVIDQAVYTAFRCDDIDKVQSDMDLVNMYANDSAEQLKITVDADVLGVMGLGAAATNQGATAGALSANIDLGVPATASIAITAVNAVDYIVYLNQVLDEANIPSEGRFVVVPAWFSSLLKTGDLRRADITGDSTGLIRTGLVGRIDRTDVYVSNNLKHQTEGANEAFYIVAGTKDATSFALQLSKSDTLPIPDSFGQYWRNLYVYGRKVTNPVALSMLYAHKG